MMEVLLQTGLEWLNTSTMNSSYYLDDDGSKDITDYINTLKMKMVKREQQLVVQLSGV